MSVRISILINNYNYGRFLSAAIESALEQTYRATEVVVVDDGSTDESGEVLAEYSDRVQILYQANGGQASAFNAGFAASTGAWIALLDADDRFVPHKLETLVAAIRSYPSAGLLAHPLDYIDEDGAAIASVGGLQRRLRFGLFDHRNRIRWGRFSITLPATSGLIIRRDVLERILPMPGEIRITADNYIKTAAVGLAPVAVIEDTLAQQRLHGQNLYTGRASTAEGRIEKEMIAARTRLHLARNFPFLAPLAWEQYGRTMQALRTTRLQASESSRLWLRAQYRPGEWPIWAHLYVIVAFGLACLRDLARLVRTLAGDRSGFLEL